MAVTEVDMTRFVPSPGKNSEEGFSLAEILVSVSILLLIVGTVTTVLLDMTNASRTIWNRTEMHSGVRGATELLQQEVGQAGLVSLPGPVTLTQTVAVGLLPVILTSTEGMFVGEQLIVGAGANQETVTVTAVNHGTKTITASFGLIHAIGTPIMAAGGFATGIVPPTMANGSTATKLKLYGDINGDGKMVFVEYTCDTVARNLYRNIMPFDAGAKPIVTPTMILLTNIVANPGGAPCFTYQTEVVGANTYVIDVAITLTVQTQQRDPITKQFQLETKTLLNVSPRNVYNVWQLASMGYTNRIQPMPPSVQNLLP